MLSLKTGDVFEGDDAVDLQRSALLRALLGVEEKMVNRNVK